MRQNKLTLIVPIRAGATADLRTLLQGIGDDVMNNAVLRFSKSPRTHFARLVIFDREPVCRLLFSACYSDALDSYITELVACVGSGLDQIFSHCDGYFGGTWLAAYEATRFAVQYEVGHQVFVAAFPDTSAGDILQSRNVRAAFDNLLDIKAVNLAIGRLFPNGLKQAPPKAKSAGISNSPVSDFIDRLLVKPMTANSNSIVKTDSQIFDMEDRVVQNQMTIVSPNKPGFSRVLLRVVLFIVQLATRILGSLGMLPMIHFAQWSIIDNGDNLLFESNYDGTWEKYIDDFVDNAYVGLDAIWGKSPTYPPGGARNIEAFKTQIRNFQYPAQVFYSAYPDCTVQNIYDDLALHRALTDSTKNPSLRLFLSGSHTQSI